MEGGKAPEIKDKFGSPARFPAAAGHRIWLAIRGIWDSAGAFEGRSQPRPDRIAGGVPLSYMRLGLS